MALSLYDLKDAYTEWKLHLYTDADLSEYKGIFESILKEYNIALEEWSIAHFEVSILMNDWLSAPMCVSPITGYTYTNEDIAGADMPAIYVKYNPNDEWRFLY